jgi:hypothetical protein
MRSSLFLSFCLLILLSGCSPVEKSTLVKADKVVLKPAGWESPFMGMFEKALFRTVMDIREFHLTGFTIIKKSADTSCRIVFANDIGMTIFDVEFIREKFISHYIFSPMQKKALLRIIEADLRAMMFYAFSTTDVIPYTDKKTSSPVLYNGKTGCYYYLEPDKLYVTEIAGGTNPWNKYRIEFDYPKGTFVKNIRIDNPGIGLIIKLGWISQ